MIRFFRAFAWFRWRVTVNAFRARGGRDVLERASRMGSVLVPIVLAAILVPVSIGLAVLAAWGGSAVGDEGEGTRVALLAARALLAVNTFALILGPMVRSASAGPSSLTRLVLLPIPRGGLFAAEVLAGIADPWLAVPLPALALFSVGIAWGGHSGIALVAAVATVLLVLALLALSAAVGFVVQLLFRDRRRGEVLTLVGAMVLAFAGFVPMMLHEGIEKGRVEESEAMRDLVKDGKGRGLLVLSQALPSEIWSRSIRAAASGKPGAALGAMAGLAAVGGALLLIASAAHRRLLDSPAEGSGRRGARSKAVTGLRLPGLSRGASAVAWVETRALLRTLIGKMAVFMNPFIVLLLAFLFPRVVRDLPLDRLPVDRGVVFAAFGAVFTFISLERILLNQFAVHGAGFTLQALAPLSERDLVWGKMVGCAILGAMAYGIFLVFLVPMSGGIHPAPLLACVLGAASAYLLFAPLAAVLAAIFPKAADLTRMGSASNPHAIANVVGFLTGNALCAPPVALYFYGAVLRKSPALGCGLVAGWAAVTCALSVPLVRLAAATLAGRRENVAMVAQGR